LYRDFCVSPVSFAAITVCVASQRVFIVVISLWTQSGNFWIHRHVHKPLHCEICT